MKNLIFIWDVPEIVESTEWNTAEVNLGFSCFYFRVYIVASYTSDHTRGGGGSSWL